MGEGIITLMIVALIVLSIAWILLPFMVAGINKRLDKVIKLLSEQQPVQSSAATTQQIQSEQGEKTEEHELTPEEKAERKEKNKRDMITAGIVLAVMVLIAVIFSNFA